MRLKTDFGTEIGTLFARQCTPLDMSLQTTVQARQITTMAHPQGTSASNLGVFFSGKEGGFKIIITWETVVIIDGCVAIGAIRFHLSNWTRLAVVYLWFIVVSSLLDSALQGHCTISLFLQITADNQY